MLRITTSICTFAVLMTGAFSGALSAAVAAPDMPQTIATEDFPASALQASAMAAQGWLSLVDQNKYGESWDRSATLTKLTVTKAEWIQILEKTRRPLGSVSSRQVLDQRTAIDPPGMPKGKYIVMFYKTVFAHKTAYELVTLYLEEGQWSVLTYQVSTESPKT